MGKLWNGGRAGARGESNGEGNDFLPLSLGPENLWTTGHFPQELEVRTRERVWVWLVEAPPTQPAGRRLVLWCPGRATPCSVGPTRSVLRPGIKSRSGDPSRQKAFGPKVREMGQLITEMPFRHRKLA
jgi:hypothetical protein